MPTLMSPRAAGTVPGVLIWMYFYPQTKSLHSSAPSPAPGLVGQSPAACVRVSQL